MIYETEHVLGQRGAEWFENRNISVETPVRYGVFTGRRSDKKGGVVPDAKGEVIVFQYWERGAVVAEKYRGEPRAFWQKPGGRKTFYNADVMDDPMLHDGRATLVIVEGEPDALAVADCGNPYVVSVPDGAPAVPKGKRPDQLDPLDPATEADGKFEYCWNNRDRLKKIKRFIIAVDDDAPGRRLGAELVRRLSAAKCSFINYPPDQKVQTDDTDKWPSGLRPCKDLNEVLLYFGSERVTLILNTAKPYPVRGLYRLSDYPDRHLETYSTQWPELSNRLRLHIPEFMVVTGLPSSGKSTWVCNLVANVCSAYGWRAAMCMPEMPTVPAFRDMMRRYWAGKKLVPTDYDEIKRTDAWINNRFVFIDTDPTGTGENDEPFDLEWIIERATDAVLRDGIRILVIDPWNEVEHARGKGESLPDYIGRAIRSLKRFARLYEVIVIVVAHPTKDVSGERGGNIRAPTLYDIEGAAHWFNKADHGVIVHRDRESNTTEIKVAKVRFEGGKMDGGAGTVGSVTLRFDRESSKFKGEEDTSALAGH